MDAANVGRDDERGYVTVLIGMGLPERSPERMDRNMWDSPTDNVKVLIVHRPMGWSRSATTWTRTHNGVRN